MSSDAAFNEQLDLVQTLPLVSCTQSFHSSSGHQRWREIPSTADLLLKHPNAIISTRVGDKGSVPQIMQNLSCFTTVDAPHCENNGYFWWDSVSMQLVAADTESYPSQQIPANVPAAPVVAGRGRQVQPQSDCPPTWTSAELPTHQPYNTQSTKPSTEGCF